MKPFPSKIIKSVSRACSGALDLLYPRKCGGCGEILRPDSRDGLFFLCPDCADDFVKVSSPMCTLCGMPFISEHGPDHVCGGCLEKSHRFSRARALGVYDGPLRKTIHGFKFHRKLSLLKPLEALLYEAFSSHFGAGRHDAAIPAPLHRQRLRERGFNQSFLLIRNWGGKKFPGAPPASPRAMERVRKTRPQAGLKASERAKNIKGAFEVKRPDLVENKRILLVDDVFTTGATANECARVLKKAGAESVDVLTLAVVVR